MDFWPTQSNIDLREEMDAILFGRADMVKQGRQVLLRRLTDEKCVCWDETSGGPRRFCTYCGGEGYKWRESLETMYIARGVTPVYKPGFLASSQYPQFQAGYMDPNRGTAFARYDCFPDYERYTLQTHKSFDRIYELKVDQEGNTVHPLTRVLKWKVMNVVPLYGDNGRIEYFELTLDKENVG